MTNVLPFPGVASHHGILLALYRRLVTRSVRMRNCAERAHWSPLMVEQLDFFEALDGIADLEKGVHLSPELLAHKDRLLAEVRSNYAAVHRYLQQRRGELSRELEQSGDLAESRSEAPYLSLVSREGA